MEVVSIQILVLVKLVGKEKDVKYVWYCQVSHTILYTFHSVSFPQIHSGDDDDDDDDNDEVHAKVTSHKTDFCAFHDKFVISSKYEQKAKK